MVQIKHFVLKEETRQRCQILPVTEEMLKRFTPISLEHFSYLKEVNSIDFNLYFRNHDEMVEFIKPQELSPTLLEQMWKAGMREYADVEICLLKKDFPKYEQIIDSVRQRKIKALLEKDPALDSKVLGVFNDLSGASQMIIRGGINQSVAQRAMQATSSLMQSQLDSTVTIGTLSRMIHNDPTLYDHSAAVAMLGVTIPQFYKRKKLDTKELEAVAQCGLYHDAGKSCVPNYILNKPGSFNDEEFQVMKTHVNHGYVELLDAIARGAPIQEVVAQVAYEHHERFKGGGYPQQKVGRLEESHKGIHLYARIVAIADTYSALLMKRVYKPAMSPESALAIMEKCADKDFDPELFAPFLQGVKDSMRMMQEKDEALKKSKVYMVDQKESFSQALKEREKDTKKQK